MLRTVGVASLVGLAATFAKAVEAAPSPPHEMSPGIEAVVRDDREDRQPPSIGLLTHYLPSGVTLPEIESTAKQSSTSHQARNSVNDDVLFARSGSSDDLSTTHTHLAHHYSMAARDEHSISGFFPLLPTGDSKQATVVVPFLPAPYVATYLVPAWPLPTWKTFTFQAPISSTILTVPKSAPTTSAVLTFEPITFQTECPIAGGKRTTITVTQPGGKYTVPVTAGFSTKPAETTSDLKTTAKLPATTVTLPVVTLSHTVSGTVLGVSPSLTSVSGKTESTKKVESTSTLGPSQIERKSSELVSVSLAQPSKQSSGTESTSWRIPTGLPRPSWWYPDPDQPPTTITDVPQLHTTPSGSEQHVTTTAKISSPVSSLSSDRVTMSKGTENPGQSSSRIDSSDFASDADQTKSGSTSAKITVSEGNEPSSKSNSIIAQKSSTGAVSNPPTTSSSNIKLPESQTSSTPAPSSSVPSSSGSCTSGGKVYHHGGQYYDAQNVMYTVYCKQDNSEGASSVVPVNSGGFATCFTACDETEGCVGFTYVGQDSGNCYLKNSMGTFVTTSDSMVSAFRSSGKGSSGGDGSSRSSSVGTNNPEPTSAPSAGSCKDMTSKENTHIDSNGATYEISCDYDFPGNDIGAAGVRSFSECFAACDNKDGCAAFAFMSNTCYLKNAALNGIKSSTGVDSAVLVKRADGSLPSKKPSSSTVPPNNPTSTASVAGSCESLKSRNGTSYIIGCSTYEIACNTDYQDSDIGSMPATEFEGCFQACEEDEGCASFSFFANTCYLKSASRDGHPATDVDAAYLVSSCNKPTSISGSTTGVIKATPIAQSTLTTSIGNTAPPDESSHLSGASRPSSHSSGHLQKPTDTAHSVHSADPTESATASSEPWSHSGAFGTSSSSSDAHHTLTKPQNPASVVPSTLTQLVESATPSTESYSHAGDLESWSHSHKPQESHTKPAEPILTTHSTFKKSTKTIELPSESKSHEGASGHFTHSIHPHTTHLHPTDHTHGVHTSIKRPIESATSRSGSLHPHELHTRPTKPPIDVHSTFATSIQSLATPTKTWPHVHTSKPSTRSFKPHHEHTKPATTSSKIPSHSLACNPAHSYPGGARCTFTDGRLSLVLPTAKPASMTLACNPAHSYPNGARCIFTAGRLTLITPGHPPRTTAIHSPSPAKFHSTAAVVTFDTPLFNPEVAPPIRGWPTRPNPTKGPVDISNNDEDGLNDFSAFEVLYARKAPRGVTPLESQDYHNVQPAIGTTGCQGLRDGKEFKLRSKVRFGSSSLDGLYLQMPDSDVMDSYAYLGSLDTAAPCQYNEEYKVVAIDRGLVRVDEQCSFAGLTMDTLSSVVVYGDAALMAGYGTGDITFGDDGLLKIKSEFFGIWSACNANGVIQLRYLTKFSKTSLLEQEMGFNEELCAFIELERVY